MGIEFTVFKGSPDGIVETITKSESPTENQVLVRITHAGICGTDEHYRLADMGMGHEGVGIVQEAGANVKGFRVGDVVGWGFNHKACGSCEQCGAGEDGYCLKREHYGQNSIHQGAFGSHAMWDASALYRIPEGLAPEHAAPLLCGGASVFGAIEAGNIRPIHRVGVVGLGGLGHLAIQFLAKMGATAVALSNTVSKREEALGLGAAEFHVMNVEMSVKPVDFLLVTTSMMPDWNLLLGIMKPRGTVLLLTISFGTFELPALPVVIFGLNIRGSSIAGHSAIQNMLEFSARREIKPIIERFPMTKSGVEEGMAKLREGKVRYRAVLCA